MAIPEPRPGLVIRYDYLWGREAARGREHSKDRPACLVAASEPDIQPRFVVILPLTHVKPSQETVGIEIPLSVRRMLGLDAEPCWVIVSDYNIDWWPNAGLTSIPGLSGRFAYGFIPPALFRLIQTKFLELNEAGRSRGVRR